LQAVLKFKPSERRSVVDALNDFARSANLPGSVVQAADLCLEEHLTNVINYGLQDTPTQEILVRLALENGELIVEVRDAGKAFDPLQRAEVDTSVPLENKPIGGLGIHLMRRFMDDLQYRRESGQNILTMRKRLPGVAV
jgi:anti-sigma regulatory factor (Ser/Thr protein kinase)